MRGVKVVALMHQIIKFIKNMINCDRTQSELDGILNRHENAAREIVKLRQTHYGFWNKGKYTDKNSWKDEFDKQVKKYEKGNTKDKLDILFDRLRVVRHQIFHGANSRTTSWGITQVKYGVQLLSVFVPFFIEQLENYPKKDLGEIPFPRVGDERDEQDDLLPLWAQNDNE